MERQLSFKRQGSGREDIESSLQGPKSSYKQDLKTSLEKQKIENKHKFEDPLYIKIGEDKEGGGPMKVTSQKHDKKKQKKMRKRSDSSHSFKSDEESEEERKHTASFDDGNKIDEAIDKGLAKVTPKGRQQSQQIRPTNTVIEAEEHEESSPVMKVGSKKKSRKNSPELNAYKADKISADTSSVKTLAQLIQVDINLDTLKNFLEDIQEAINDHAKQITSVQQDLKRKAYEKTIGHYFQKISEGLHKECGERPHAFRLDSDQNFLAENFQTDDSTQLKRQAEKMSDKFEIIGLNIINFHKFRSETQDRLEKLEKQMPKCFTTDQFREESQLQETRTMKYIDDRLGTFQENLNAYKKQLNEAMAFFGKKVDDNQSETLWRIKDCEELLKCRVSDKYVNDALKGLDDKLVKQISHFEEKGIERLEKTFKELAQRVVQTNTFFNEKIDDVRRVIMSYDSKITNMATLDKLMSIQSGQKDMKYNIERELEMLQEHVKETKDKISELTKRFSNLEQAAMNDSFANYQPMSNSTAHNQNQRQAPGGTNSRNQYNQGSTANAVDKASQGSTKNLNKSPESTKNGQRQTSPISPLMKKRTRVDQNLMAEVEKRMHLFDETIFGLEQRIDQMKKQMDEKITKEDVKKLTSDKISKEDLDHLIPNEEIMQEKMKYLVRDEIENLSNKMLEQVKMLDNKMIRLRAELDIHGVYKQLDRKANEDQVKNDFNNHEFKIATLDRNIIRMASDFETFQLALNKLHSHIVELQEANRDVLLGKRTTNCLSCGKGGEATHNVMGRDGRMYKGGPDQKASQGLMDDMSIPINQYMVYDGLSPLPGQQQQQQQNLLNNVSANDLPHSSQDFYSNKIKQSNSFYDIGGIYDNAGMSNNLPSVHRKKNSQSNHQNGLNRNIQSQVGLIQQSQNQVQSAQPQVNSSFIVSTSNNNKKKLPFGFQVQKEKKELFKVNGTRGKSSTTGQRPVSNRIEDQGVHDNLFQDRRFNLNSTFEV